MAEFYVTREIQEFYLVEASTKEQAEFIAKEQINMYKMFDMEVKDIRIEEKDG